MKNDTVVFVHGAWHGKWCWDKYFRPRFEKEGYKVVTFDLPGHDQAGKIKGINKFTLGDYTKSLENEISKLDVDPIIIGHSMGGLVVQKYLENNTCKKAVLLASIPPYGVIKATLRFALKSYFLPSVLMFNLYNLVNTEEKSKHAFFSEDLSSAALTEYTKQLCSESFLAFLNMLFPRIKIKAELDTPMLVLGAKKDKIFSEAEVRYTARKYGAELLIIDDVAHDVMLDVNHALVSDAIIDWIKK